MPPSAHRLYLFAFLFSIPPTIISWIALVAPRYDGIKHTGALAVTPPPGRDGPSIWIGLIRTCSRANASSDTECDQYSNHHLGPDFKYDVSILPPSAPLFTLRVASVHLRGLAVTAAVFSTVFTIIAFFMFPISWYDERDLENREQMRRKQEFDRQRVFGWLEEFQLTDEAANLLLEDDRRNRFTAWIQGRVDPAPPPSPVLNEFFTLVEDAEREYAAIVNFGLRIDKRKKFLDGLRILSAVISFSFGFIGSITFAILWVHFEMACRNFNLIYNRDGTPAIPLVASLGLTFNLAISGYILFVIPLGIVFYELHEERKNWRWVNEGKGLWLQGVWHPILGSVL